MTSRLASDSIKADNRIMKKVLLIDDEPLLRECFVEIIQGLGCEVIEAENGLDGLVQLKKNKIDLIITDIDMPIMNGVEFIQNVRQLNIQTPIVVISGAARLTQDQLISFGANKFVEKPIHDYSELINI